MSSEKFISPPLFVVTFVGLLLLALFIGLGQLHGRNEVRKQAVQAGVAEWIVDKDGVVQFQWIKDKAGAE